jgi:hypothetical protein
VCACGGATVALSRSKRAVFRNLVKKTWERMLLIFLTVDAALSKGRPTARKEGVELIVAL